MFLVEYCFQIHLYPHAILNVCIYSKANTFKREKEKVRHQLSTCQIYPWKERGKPQKVELVNIDLN